MHDPKYNFVEGGIVNRASGKQIPEDEPTFLFRASDVLALDVLRYYRSRVASGSQDPDHLDGMDIRIADFEKFRSQHPERMKSPDSIIDEQWTN